MTITIKNGAGADVAIPDPNPNGRALAAASAPVVLSTEDLAKLELIRLALNQLHDDNIAGGELPAGDNVIGKFDVQANGVPVTTAAPMPVVSQAASVLFAKIDHAAAGAGNVLVTNASGGKKVRVLGFGLVCTAANVVTFFGNTTALTGAMSFAANGGISAPQSTAGLFETAVNQSLNMTLGSAAQVSGWLVYQLV